jgi:hypothetical protein
MKRFIIILILLFAISLLWRSVEGFEDPLIEKYKQFALFYNSFLDSWEKAITTSIGLDTPQTEGATKPSQPTRGKLNNYITTLSNKIGMLPALTDPLPTFTNATEILPHIPKVFQPYLTALQWMNGKLEESHEKLQKSLRGETFIGSEFIGLEFIGLEFIGEAFTNQFNLLENEGFETQCQQLTQQIAQCQQEQKATDEKTLSDILDSFLTNKELMAASAKNAALIAESKKIENQAKSGELLNQLNLPQEDTIKYEIPPGGDALAQMEKNDPERYKRLKSEGGAFFSIKQTIEQINRNLR